MSRVSREVGGELVSRLSIIPSTSTHSKAKLLLRLGRIEAVDLNITEPLSIKDLFV